MARQLFGTLVVQDGLCSSRRQLPQDSMFAAKETGRSSDRKAADERGRTSRCCRILFCAYLWERSRQHRAASVRTPTRADLPGLVGR